MAKKVVELEFSVPNKVGALAKITDAFEKSKVNIHHIWACGDGKTASFGIVTDRNATAKSILKKHGINAKEKPLLVMNLANKVGSLAKAAKKLAKGNINITCLSATTSGSRASVLLGTANDKKAMRLV
jgi:hypothetical protein